MFESIINRLILVLIIIYVIKWISVLIAFAYISMATKLLRTFSKRKRSNRSYEIDNEASYLLIKSPILITIGLVRYLSVITGKIPNHFLRNILYRHVFHLKMGQDVMIFMGLELRASYKITIASHTVIGNDAKLDGRNGIEIGENVNLSNGVWIWTEQHDPQSADFSLMEKNGKVVIKDRAWISSSDDIAGYYHWGGSCSGRRCCRS